MRHYFGLGHDPISDEDHKTALERAAADLKGKQIGEIRELARGLELPFDTVFDFYRTKIIEIETARRSERMRSAPAELAIHSIGNDRRPVKINPGEIYEVIVRPQTVAFRPVRLEILDRPELWTIRSFRIGNREQLKHGTVRGDLFDALIEQGHEGPFEVVQTAMDLALLVQWHGDEPAMFEGKFHGIEIY